MDLDRRPAFPGDGAVGFGALADRVGRRRVLVAIVAGTAAVAAAATGWGLMINASVAWAPWISELYPVRLRSMALSIFNWGRTVSMLAPIVTASVAGTFGLGWATMLSVGGFVLAGLVWLALPETLVGTRATGGHAGAGEERR